MNLFLVRHGDAVSAAVDPDRPLSDWGRQQALLIGREFRAKEYEISEIRSSRKLRAKQTAQIVGRELGAQTAVLEADGLAPDSSPEALVSQLEMTQGDLMIVSHLPFIPSVAYELIGGGFPGVVDLGTCSVLEFAKKDEGPWQFVGRWGH